ncbi:polysaccharide deacetylase family protein [Paenibacillus ginsengarvi]|uniref:Polysaccharide deacetylase family protein n=1 Tax=Paenibacillus ginsengarvi TaxID=400777 RepID=A0A3B0CFU0_9BACL|nr:polysaccharide deacetylase family protein [Paenibacillus ginsengarvi]RKN84110.1 polysaccharide deacetylase family protein [Paenibacillus ginsengarvi]
MKERLLFAFLLIVAIYTIVPWVVTRIFAIGVFRRGKASNQVALTFDDGPDPVYTPHLLDLLRKHGAKATFFVLGSKAERYPELIKRIHDEGHQLGIHNYSHTSNWFMSPWSVRDKHADRSADIVASITGTKPAFYRPPWGILNFFDLFFLKSYTVVLWSVMPKDWRSRIGRNKLKARLMRSIRPGSVVLLHDSGETFGADRDAPAYMLEALDEVLVHMRQNGLVTARVDELLQLSVKYRLGLFKRVIVNAWMAWERCFVKLFQLKLVDSDNPLVKLRVREYQGRQSIVLPDGEQIRRGDLIAEMHLDNYTLFKLGLDSRSSVQLATQLIRRTRMLMPTISQLLLTDPQYEKVKGLYGITMIHRGSKQLGFTVVDLPEGLFASMTRTYLRLLLYVVHPRGKERLKEKTNLLEPKIVAISKNELKLRYIA